MVCTETFFFVHVFICVWKESLFIVFWVPNCAYVCVFSFCWGMKGSYSYTSSLSLPELLKNNTDLVLFLKPNYATVASPVSRTHFRLSELLLSSPVQSNSFYRIVIGDFQEWNTVLSFQSFLHDLSVTCFMTGPWDPVRIGLSPYLSECVCSFLPNPTPKLAVT